MTIKVYLHIIEARLQNCPRVRNSCKTRVKKRWEKGEQNQVGGKSTTVMGIKERGSGGDDTDPRQRKQGQQQASHASGAACGQAESW